MFIIKIFVEQTSANVMKYIAAIRISFLLRSNIMFNYKDSRVALVVINVADIFNAGMRMTLSSGSYRAALISTETRNGLLSDNYYNAEAYNSCSKRTAAITEELER